MATAAKGAISRGTVYPIRTFQSLMGWGTQALRTARLQGLRTVYHANMACISGDDFHDWIQSSSRVTNRGARGEKKAGGKSRGRPRGRKIAETSI